MHTENEILQLHRKVRLLSVGFLVFAAAFFCLGFAYFNALTKRIETVGHDSSRLHITQNRSLDEQSRKLARRMDVVADVAGIEIANVNRSFDERVTNAVLRLHARIDNLDGKFERQIGSLETAVKEHSLNLVDNLAREGESRHEELLNRFLGWNEASEV